MLDSLPCPLLDRGSGLYLLNWIYRYFTEDGYSHWLVWVAGTVQTGLYCDFFYYYVTSRMKGTKMQLPTSV